METESFAELLLFLGVQPHFINCEDPSSESSSESDDEESDIDDVLLLEADQLNFPECPPITTKPLDYVNPLLNFTAFIADKDSGLRAMNNSGIPMWGDPGKLAVSTSSVNWTQLNSLVQMEEEPSTKAWQRDSPHGGCVASLSQTTCIGEGRLLCQMRDSRRI